mgnify:CR=1 FL=1|jgi:glycerol-3-phosphate acyltransferase PlsX
MKIDGSGKKYKIAVDAMGGDNAPNEIVKGALDSIASSDIEVILVGDKDKLSEYIPTIVPSNLHCIYSTGVVYENEQPLEAARSKPKASVFVCAELVKNKQADAFVTMGSTGAAMAAGVLKIGNINGIERPSLGGPFLGLAPRTILIDLGSNVDNRPSQLLNYAVLGSTFSRVFMGVENPRIGLLSVGAEEGKGNRQVKETYPLLKDSGLNFIGNVEGFDIPLGKADVVVCDGFVGNILMKFSEGLGVAVLNYIKSSGLTGDHTQNQVVEKLYSLTNFVEHLGGGPLLGLNGVCIVGHGRSMANSVSAAINMAKMVLDLDLVNLMDKELTMVKSRLNVD